MVQVVVCFPSMHEALDLIPAPERWRQEDQKFKVILDSKLKASLGCLKPFTKTKEIKNKATRYKEANSKRHNLNEFHKQTHKA